MLNGVPLKKSVLWGKAILILTLFTITAIMVFLFILGYLLNILVSSDRPNAEINAPSGFYTFSQSPQPSPTIEFTPLPSSTSIPTLTSPTAVKNIPIDFTSQAPFGIWDETHEEACEEAGLVMIYVWTNHLQLTPEFADNEMLKLVEWQKNNLGYFENTSALDTALIARNAYNLEPRIINNPSVEDIKTEINNGNVLLIGMAGKVLQNPFFKPPGPVYHMLLFRGYDGNGFFVNDPGTRRGNNFYYTYENIKKAAHDWNGSEENLATSPPVALVFSRNN